MILILSIICMAIAIWAYVKHSSSKSGRIQAGNKGESKVIQELSSYEHIDDFNFRVNNSTSQIDHLFPMKDGRICLLETKNWNGVIVGNPWANDVYVVNHGNKSKRFNPYAQSKRHADLLNTIISSKIIHVMISTGNLSYQQETHPWYMTVTELRDYLKKHGIPPLSQASDDWYKLKDMMLDKKYQANVKNSHASKIKKKDNSGAMIWVILSIVLFLWYILRSYIL